MRGDFPGEIFKAVDLCLRSLGDGFQDRDCFGCLHIPDFVLLVSFRIHASSSVENRSKDKFC